VTVKAVLYLWISLHAKKVILLLTVDAGEAIAVLKDRLVTNAETFTF
jgi:hypothetical protein